ncbi:MAG: sirohydrochlorin chelatase [Pseudonocardia sp.]
MTVAPDSARPDPSLRPPLVLVAHAPLVLVAHGTRDEAGTALIGRLAAAVGRRLPGVAVRTAFVDVRGPWVADAVSSALDTLPPDTGDVPVVVVPGFLASGYHVRHDLPGQLAAAGLAGRTVLTPLLGPDPLLVAAAEDRLRRAGQRPGDAVLLAATGSRDPRALPDVTAAATLLGARLDTDVRVGFLASGEPKVAELIGSARRTGRRVAVASWLLAPGLFHRRLVAGEADVVAEPLGTHPGVIRAIVSRYRETVPSCNPVHRKVSTETLMCHMN